MRGLLMMLLAATALLGVVYLCIGAEHAVLPGNPLAALGVGLIGLGLCKQARDAQRA